MGCDFSWGVKESNVEKQRQASLFLDLLLSNGLLEDIVIKKYNHVLDGYFINIDSQDFAYRDEMQVENKLLLTGITFYDQEFFDIFEDPFEIAHRQFSFVFKNTVPEGANGQNPIILPKDYRNLEGNLITFEEIDNLSKDKYCGLPSKYPTLKNYKGNIGAFQRKSYNRLGGVGIFTRIVYLIKNLFIPSFYAGDDYCQFESSEIAYDNSGYKNAFNKPSARWWALETFVEKYLDIKISRSMITQEQKDYWQVEI